MHKYPHENFSLSNAALHTSRKSILHYEISHRFDKLQNQLDSVKISLQSELLLINILDPPRGIFYPLRNHCWAYHGISIQFFWPMNTTVCSCSTSLTSVDSIDIEKASKHYLSVLGAHPSISLFLTLYSSSR